MSDICTKIVDGDHNPPIAQKAESEYIMISSKNVVNDSIIHLDDVRHLSRADFELSNARTQVSKGDVLFTSVASLGRTCIYDLDYPITFQRSVTVICTKIFNRYLKLFLDSPLYQNYVGENARGTAQKGFYINQISDSWVPIPPLNEQIRIVEKAQSLLDIVQIINYSKEETSNNIIALKSKILDLAISGKLVRQDKSNEPAIELLKRINPQYQPTDNRHYANVPETWEVVALKDVTEIITGSTPSKSVPAYYSGDVPFYKPNDLDQGRHVRTASEHLSQQGKEISRSIPSNSIAVCCIGSIGKCGYIEHEGVTNQQINTIIPNEAIFPLYLFYFCNSTSFIDKLKSESSAVTIPIVNKSKLSTIQIPLPPISEQKRIVNAIETILHKLDIIVGEIL